MGIGALIRVAREGRGWSQGRLAERLCEISGRASITRDEVKRWESGKVIPGRFWQVHLAGVLNVPFSEIRREVQASQLNRRAVLAAASSGAVLLTAGGVTAADMLASIAGGDDAWLSRHISPYDFSVSLANLATSDRGTERRLTTWLHDGSTSLLRGNAQGTLFKTRRPDLIELAEQSMRHDEDTRRRCMRCFARRTFSLPWTEAANYHAYDASPREISALTTLLSDPLDASNRWCAAVHLGEASANGSRQARQALTRALRVEPSRENVRTIGLSLIGERPWT